MRQSLIALWAALRVPRDERGAQMAEYVLLASLVALIVMVAVIPIGPALSQMIDGAVAAF